MNPFKKPPKQPPAPPPPPVPTIDEAAMREEFSRKVRRRKGHARNSYSSGGEPSVASRVLLG
jgi:hypothetical protein